MICIIIPLNVFKVKTERIVTQEHLEYDSDDSSCSNDSEESDMSSWEILEPEEYKTRTEESYTEYFVNGKGSEKVTLQRDLPSF